MAQRFYRQNIAQYNPLSFEEMLFAPSMMRQKHDALDASLMDTQTSLGQYNALSQDQDFVQQAIDPVSQELNQMAEQLSKEGFNQQSMTGFRKLKSQRDKLFSPTGDVGIAQSRLASFQEKAKELKEQYKNNPKIADFYINQLAQSKGLQRDVDGNIINQGLNPINNVRHYDAKEVNELINSQLDNIKPVLMRELNLSRQQLQGLSSVQDLFMAFEEYGVDQDRATKVLLSQVSPEVIASAQQYGRINMGSPEAGIEALQNQIAGAAAGISGVHRKDYDRKIVTNEDRKFDRDQETLRSSLLLPGARLNTSQMQNLEFLGAEYKDGSFQIKNQNSMISKIQDPFGINNNIYRDSEGNQVSQDEAVERFMSAGTGGGLIPVLKEGYRKETLNEKAMKAESKFLEIKENSPVLKNLSKEEALKVMQNNFENLQQTYSYIDVFKTNFDFIKSSLKANLPNSTFMDTDGNIMNLQDLSDKTGLTPEEIGDKLQPIGTGIRPTIGAVVETTLYDKKGNDIPIFVQSDALSSGVAETTTSVLNHIYSGQGTGQVKTKYTDPETGESLIGINTFVLESYDGNPRVLTAPANIKLETLNELSSMSNEEIINLFDNSSNVKIQSVDELTQQTANKIKNNLQGTKL